MSDQTKHVWRSRRVFPQEQRYRNTLFPREQRRYIGGGIRWWLVIAVVCIFGVAGTAIWSPILTIMYVTVAGTATVDAAVIRKAADEYLDAKTLGIFPRRSFVVASSSGLASSVKTSLSSEPSVVAVSAQKTFPFLMAVTVTEQIPNVVYINNDVRYLLNRSGTITGAVLDGVKVPKRFPQLYDQTSRTVVAGSSVVKPSTLDALFTAQDRMAKLTDVTITSFFLPPVACPKPEEKDEEGEGTNANVNAGSASKNANGAANSSRNNGNNTTNTSVSNKNTSSSVRKGNANTNTAPSIPACDLNAIVLKSPELNIRTSEKWDILLRTDKSVDDQIIRLGRVLYETKPDRKKLRSIDLRFGENVIVR